MEETLQNFIKFTQNNFDQVNKNHEIMSINHDTLIKKYGYVGNEAMDGSQSIGDNQFCFVLRNLHFIIRVLPGDELATLACPFHDYLCCL